MSDKNSIGRIIILAPIIFICHFLEEAPGFVAWFNAHVSRGITSGLFWSVNITALVITILVVFIEFFMPSFLSTSLIVLWFSFLMFANAILHIGGSIVDQHYMPGLITAIILYIPYYFWVVAIIIKKRKLPFGWLAVLAIVGSLPMLIHGYRIIFLGDRLF